MLRRPRHDIWRGKKILLCVLFAREKQFKCAHEIVTPCTCSADPLLDKRLTNRARLHRLALYSPNYWFKKIHKWLHLTFFFDTNIHWRYYDNIFSFGIHPPVTTMPLRVWQLLNNQIYRRPSPPVKQASSQQSIQTSLGDSDSFAMTGFSGLPCNSFRA